jgi:hypothetical protein
LTEEAVGLSPWNSLEDLSGKQSSRKVALSFIREQSKILEARTSHNHGKTSAKEIPKLLE